MYLQDISRYSLGPGPTVRPSWAPWGQPGPRFSCSENLRSDRYFQRFFALIGVQGHVAHVGPVLDPSSAPDASTHNQVAHSKPNLYPSVPKLRHGTPVGLKLGPSWSQLARVRHKLRPSYAQVGPKWAPVWPNLRPRTAKFDPSRLLAALCPILWVRAVLVAKRLE